LYLPEEWCADLARRRKAKIPESLSFQTKPRLAAGLARQAASWRLPRAPILGDCAYGDDSGFRATLHEQGLEYVLAVSPGSGLFGPETSFVVPAQTSGKRGR